LGYSFIRSASSGHYWVIRDKKGYSGEGPWGEEYLSLVTKENLDKIKGEGTETED